MKHDYRQALACAQDAALHAGTLLRQAFHEAAGAGEAVYPEVGAQTLSRLKAGFPQYGYRGEELGFPGPPQDAAGHLWLVDPHDGALDFEEGCRGPAVSIALLREGVPVLGVVYAYSAPDDGGDLFTWAEGAGPLLRNRHPVAGAVRTAPETVLVSRRASRSPQGYACRVAPLHFRGVPSLAYRLALVAAGEARAAVCVSGPVGWDYAGGHALLRARVLSWWISMACPSATTATAGAAAMDVASAGSPR